MYIYVFMYVICIHICIYVHRNVHTYLVKLQSGPGSLNQPRSLFLHTLAFNVKRVAYKTGIKITFTNCRTLTHT